MRDRAWRRTQSKKKQDKRVQNLESVGFDIKEPGKLRNNHYGCGCRMCKPWKHGAEPKLKPSERKKCQD